jgi:hypothetical protein
VPEDQPHFEKDAQTCELIIQELTAEKCITPTEIKVTIEKG